MPGEAHPHETHPGPSDPIEERLRFVEELRRSFGLRSEPANAERMRQLQAAGRPAPDLATDPTLKAQLAARKAALEVGHALLAQLVVAGNLKLLLRVLRRVGVPVGPVSLPACFGLAVSASVVARALYAAAHGKPLAGGRDRSTG